MLTLALTATVPATVDPEAGEVIVTTRLPVGKGGSMGGSSCASARGGMQLAPKIISKTATRTLFMFFSMDNASSTYRRSIEIFCAAIARESHQRHLSGSRHSSKAG